MREIPSAPAAHRIIGVDTSLRSSGIGGVSATGQQMCAFYQQRVKIAAGRPVSECLGRLQTELNLALETEKPDALALEGAFFGRNIRTAMILGQARGVVIAAAASRGIPVYEYAPRRVKQAVAGYGAASKEQMQKMVQRILGLDSLPQEDIADGLALAICHLHQWVRLPTLRPEPI